MTPQTIALPFTYSFGKPSDSPVAVDSATIATSTHPVFVVTSGGRMTIKDGRGWTMAGDAPPDDPYRIKYAKTDRPQDTDNGLHPQNLFRAYSRTEFGDSACSAVYRIHKYHLSASSERKESNGLFIFGRATIDGMNGYYGGLRADGDFTIKRKRAGKYTTLAQAQFFQGVYNHDSSPLLLPISTWIGVKLAIKTLPTGVQLTLSHDLYWTGDWKEVHTVLDKSPLLGKGHYALRTDFMDAEFDAYSLTNV